MIVWKIQISDEDINFAYHFYSFDRQISMWNEPFMMTSSNGPFSALLAMCAGNTPVTGEFPTQRPATRSFDVFFDLRLNKRLSKQPYGRWLETLSCPLWRHCNVVKMIRWLNIKTLVPYDVAKLFIKDVWNA